MRFSEIKGFQVYKVISDITDTRKELNKPVYEANKPIYGSNNDDGYVEGEDYDYEEPSSYDEDFDYDVDEYGEPKVTLPDNYDDDDFDMDNTESEDNEMLRLAIRNYVENKHEQGIDPTINHVNSLKICRDSGMTCRSTYDLLANMNFEIEDDQDKILSALRVYA